MVGSGLKKSGNSGKSISLIGLRVVVVVVLVDVGGGMPIANIQQSLKSTLH